MKIKSILCIALVFYSLVGYSQVDWSGDYNIEYEGKNKPGSESKIKISKGVDSIIKDSSYYLWSFNAFQRGKWLWEYSGYADQNGNEQVLALYARNFRSINKKAEKKFLKKYDKGKPIYLIKKENGSYTISNIQGKKKSTLPLVKKS